MNQINIQHHRTGFGELTLGSYRGGLCLLSIGRMEMKGSGDDRIGKRLKAEFVEQDDAVLCETRRQIDEYMAGRGRVFDVPLSLVGTTFQKEVWNALLQVPYGTTSTYLQIARAIDNEKAVRAVGSACKVNPIGIIVPCHRIVASDGSLGGYYGGLALKRRLLDFEQQHHSRQPDRK